ncbi:hypothetical protein VNO77_22008 [Canavalia gladiata]|uniref:Wings apart-like protein C-terminal domain-containing protein n=1 Tax=Canavalia gladiata TaxID=3824 RepID=A0AAN9L1T3_CANGL
MMGRRRRVPRTFSDDERWSMAFPSQDSKRKRAKMSNNSTAQEVVDEVYFALDGLRKDKDQPPWMTRANLLYLLSICATSHHRTLLRSQRMAKTIVDAILALSLDDPPTNLAAAALFFILTIDKGQDDYLLESTGSIRFLIKLLRPIVSTISEDRAPKFGSKLLALQKNAGILKNTMEILNSSSVAIHSRVQEILVNCKELKSTSLNDSQIERPELCPEWLALLTMEKACLSAISFDETSGVVQKTGGNFKEKLRELGGLDAVFEITMHCLSDLECWMEDCSLSTKDLRNDNWLKSLILLLKCLKIMENTTFLSKDNQSHLLGLKRKLSPQATPLSVVELIITVIKILSDLCSSQNASVTSNDNKPQDPFSMENCDSKLNLITGHKESEVEFSNSAGVYYDKERASSVKSFNHFQKCQCLTSTQLERSQSVSETPSTSVTCNYSQNMRLGFSTQRSCSGASRGLESKTAKIQVEILDKSRDPFAFDEDDTAPSMWDLLSGKQKISHSKSYEVTNREFENMQDLLSGKQKKSHSKSYEVTNREFENRCQSQTSVSRQKLKTVDVNCSSSYICDEASSSLLIDCLLTAVKVLMNLANENPVGCQQIAAYGGLETMPLLIADHFPSFCSSSLSFAQIRENTSRSAKGHQHDRHLTDHELDFLVAILVLLVNLIEKDGNNRSRLAAASVQIPTSDGLNQEAQMGVIQLLCAIFLANQCRGEEAEEDKYWLPDNEAAVLQDEKEAEKMIVEAYSALLLAFLSTESKSIREAIADHLPYHNLSILVPVLDRFLRLIKLLVKSLNHVELPESSANGKLLATSASFNFVATAAHFITLTNLL